MEVWYLASMLLKLLSLLVHTIAVFVVCVQVLMPMCLFMVFCPSKGWGLLKTIPTLIHESYD